METGARWRNLSLFIALTAVSLIIPLVIRHNSDKRDKNISDQLKKESRTKLLQRLWGGKFVFTLVPFQYEHRLADSIFFVETNDKLSQISAKILCAFESAALKNPDKRIAVVLNSASDLQFAPILHSEVRKSFVKSSVQRMQLMTPISDCESPLLQSKLQPPNRRTADRPVVEVRRFAPREMLEKALCPIKRRRAKLPAVQIRRRIFRHRRDLAEAVPRGTFHGLPGRGLDQQRRDEVRQESPLRQELYGETGRELGTFGTLQHNRASGDDSNRDNPLQSG